MRYVVLGAGAVGGTIGGRLHQHGREVVLVARGAHLDALRADGLTLRDPDTTVTLDVTAVGSPREVEWRDGDVVLLTTKTHQTPAALEQLAAAAPPSTPVVCVQNGVANEAMALRLFPEVHGVPVMLPATHLRPGEVLVSSAPCTGLLDIGRIPAGIDDVDGAVAADLEGATFSARPDVDIMRWKRSKLLMNLGNAVEASCRDMGTDAARHLRRAARDEAEACFAAAGLSWADDEEFRARRGDLLTIRPIDGEDRGGGSTWQSLARGMGATEVDYLNGEIVLLGRQHGMPTPVNALLQDTVRRLAADGVPPGTLDAADLVARLDGAGVSVLLVATGGTIASRPSAEGVQGALDGAALLDQAEVDASDIDVLDLNQGPSWSFTPSEAVSVARAALDGATTHDGVVVTHGTDAVEETLFLTWLLSGDGQDRAPIVFTAAMRDADAPDADGPANLAHAIATARLRVAAELGPVLAFGGALHAARWVTKIHTTALDAFAEVGGEGPVPPPDVPAGVEPEGRRVVQVQAAIGADPDVIADLLKRGARGLVVEGTGAGNVNRALVPGIEQAIAAGVPVVVSTRCPRGAVTPIYGGPGGGWWLREQGVIGAGDLPTHKARWGLAVALAIDPEPDAVRTWFATLLGQAS